MAVRRKTLVALSVLPVALLWLAPATRAANVSKLAGAWTWWWKDQSGRTHRHLLEVEGIGTKLAARERFDDQSPVPCHRTCKNGR